MKTIILILMISLPIIWDYAMGWDDDDVGGGAI
jgi:hypothetical protein